MQFQLTSMSKFVAAAILAASTTAAFAQSAGDTVVSTGWFHIVPQDSSTPLQVTSPVSLTLTGSGATAGTTDTLGLSVTQFLTDNWAASLDIGIPPTYKLEGTGTLSSLGRIGQAKQLAPALLLKYYFGTSQSQFRPILGLGAAHVSYKSIKLTDAFQHFAGSAFGDPNAVTTADLSSSWAPVLTAGADYAFNKKWHVTLTVSYLNLKTKANLTTNTNTLGKVSSTTTLMLDPIVTYLTVGYVF